MDHYEVALSKFLSQLSAVTVATGEAVSACSQGNRTLCSGAHQNSKQSKNSTYVQKIDKEIKAAKK